LAKEEKKKKFTEDGSRGIRNGLGKVVRKKKSGWQQEGKEK